MLRQNHGEWPPIKSLHCVHTRTEAQSINNLIKPIMRHLTRTEIVDLKEAVVELIAADKQKRFRNPLIEGLAKAVRHVSPANPPELYEEDLGGKTITIDTDIFAWPLNMSDDLKKVITVDRIVVD